MVAEGGGDTENVALGPAAAALLPTASLAVLAAMLIPNVPVPVKLLNVIVRTLVPEPLTATLAEAFPIVFKVIFPFTSEILLAPV